MRYGNHYWSIPFATNNIGIFYRPSLLAAAGIEKLPTTWQELEEVSQALKTQGITPLLLALGQGEFAVFTWFALLLECWWQSRRNARNRPN